MLKDRQHKPALIKHEVEHTPIVHRKHSSTSSTAAVAQLLSMTKQPSLTSLLNLGLICGSLGDSSSSPPQPPPSPLTDIICAPTQNEDNGEKSVPEDSDKQAKEAKASELAESSVEMEQDEPSVISSRPAVNTSEASTATAQLTAPKLSRNEVSISSLSSFFMNNQLKTLNFLYYPSLITKSKWSKSQNEVKQSGEVTATTTTKEVDDEDEDTSTLSDVKRASPEVAELGEIVGESTTSMSNSDSQTTCRPAAATSSVDDKHLDPARPQLSDVLSEHSQIKSSESIDEQVFHEKLAYLIEADSANNRSFREKFFESIKRRLSLPSETAKAKSNTGENSIIFTIKTSFFSLQVLANILIND